MTVLILNINFQGNFLYFRPRMPSTLDDFDVIGTIGSGSYGTCKKIRRKRDGKVDLTLQRELK